MKSIDEVNIIAALLQDISNVHGVVFNHRALKNTLNKCSSRTRKEGMSFLTKTLPRLGKALDKALSASTPLNATKLGFKPLPGSELPMFMGEFFTRVLAIDGTLLPHPCETSVKVLRQVLYLFYKYELPFTDEQEQAVVSKFCQTETDISNMDQHFKDLEVAVTLINSVNCRSNKAPTTAEIVRGARDLLARLFLHFDPRDINPRHGPGAVATKQKLWEKFRWTNVSSNITETYPFDEYFCSSMGQVCDTYQTFQSVTDMDLPAKVVLVPKDSRGPRLISCEPVDYQWIQQGLASAIVRLVESHPLTKERVNFTDQSLNQFYALVSSRTGRYATLDLNEASDRVSVDLVRLLFPEHVFTYLMACRSSSTVLPSGEVLPLRKFAPMGSALCFPILALSVWSLLAAGLPDAYAARDASDILVYGDDVIVPTAKAGEAMSILESFGLKINRDKSCTSGLFRESCGTDAFQGVNVTPVRLRTVWKSSRCPNVYSSWIAYANSLFDRQYFCTYDYIVRGLHAVYGAIPSKDMFLTCPSLAEVSDEKKPKVRRFNKNLQKFEYFVTDLKSPVIQHEIDGWSMLLRYFSERPNRTLPHSVDELPARRPVVTSLRGLATSYEVAEPFSVRQYTCRRTSMLVRRWR